MDRPYPTNDHLPQRPSWTCNRGCGEWPCEPARQNLLAESVENGLALGMYLVSCWMTAVEVDLRDHDTRELYQRMIGWRHVAKPVPVTTPRTEASIADPAARAPHPNNAIVLHAQLIGLR